MSKVEKDVTPKTEKQRSRMSQADVPRYALEQSLRVAEALNNDFAGRAVQPLSVAQSMDLSPASSYFRDLCGSSMAYGLTEGGAYAESISLTPLGKRIVAPTSEGDDLQARIEAVLQPRVLREFFAQYNGSKFPSDRIAPNVLAEMNVPRDRVEEVLAILKQNGQEVGIIQTTKGGPWVSLDAARSAGRPAAPRLEEPSDIPPGSDANEVSEITSGNGERKAIPQMQPGRSNRVYISHGKDRAITDQLKEILRFGRFEPIVSVEKESAAIPVPDKVFEDMRSCSAGVIHVMREGKLLDEQGGAVIRINENVLIEIGAAIALYNKNVVLLVEKGLELPSNLQGLYKCEYEGDKLDYEATMKLLKTFNDFQLG